MRFFYKTLLIIFIASLAACNEYRPDNNSAPIKIKNTVAVEWDDENVLGLNNVIKNYYQALNETSNRQARKEIILRLASLEMQKLEDLYANSDRTASNINHSNPINLYRNFMETYPEFPENNLILYQLAKAYELNSDTDNTITTIKQLIADYPGAENIDEMYFRLGELYFSNKAYNEAIKYYSEVINIGDNSPLYEKALYKKGWAIYKDGRNEDAVDAFYDFLDKKFSTITETDLDAAIASLTRSSQELVQDTLRIVNLVFSSSDDPDITEKYFKKKGARNYEHLAYQSLGEFYLSQNRIMDAAGTFNKFSRNNPGHPQAPFIDMLVIKAYEQGKFSKLLLEAKKSFVTRYQDHDDQNIRTRLRPHVKSHLNDLTRYYHAYAQKTKKPEDYKIAAHWYQIFLNNYPGDPRSGELNFLLAEALFENGQYREALKEYEKTAYNYPLHEHASESGYAALLTYKEIEKQLSGEDREKWQNKTIDSALHYTDTFPRSPRALIVLSTVATDLYTAEKYKQAAQVANKILDLTTDGQSEQRRNALAIVSHISFKNKDYPRAENTYKELLKLTPENHDTHSNILEKIAASIYKQGELARENTDLEKAAQHFLRVRKETPGATIIPTALYDASAVFIEMKDWNRNIKILEDFQKTYPDHELNQDINIKLAYSYTENGDTAKAAEKLEIIANNDPSPEVQRDATWRSAKLYQEVKDEVSAIRIYKKYIIQFPHPLDQAVEARNIIATIHKDNGDTASYHYWLKEIITADREGGSERTDRTHYLAGNGEFILANLVFDEYKDIKLVEPLKKNLKKKKKAMEASLAAYQRSLEYDLSTVTTAANYKIADIYFDFGKALLESERPKGLNDDEIEQYDILLEEQAYPFEEQAIDAHKLNIARVTSGIYDDWVKMSFSALSTLLPGSYNKEEKSEGTVNAIN